MKKFLFVAVLMLQATFSFAQDTLEFSSEEAKAGTTVSTKVNLINAVPYTLAEFSVNVPEAITVKGKVGSRCTEDHTVTCKLMKSCEYENYARYKVLVSDQDDNCNFEGESGGDIAILNFTIPTDFEAGEYPVYLTGVVLSDIDSNGPEYDEIIGKIVVSKETPDAIANVEFVSSKNVYDLQGRRTNAKNGVLLVNGQKQIVK